MKQGGDVRVSTNVESPLGIQLNGIGIDQIILQITAQAFIEMAGKLRGALSQQLNRSPRRTLQEVKPHGD